ncbi:hypothetical protein [Actinomadura macrotermitis]|uniref:Uncharacterized protein n=1 Tax=Actinomadura macrotermitis TaxID=2585200 RepID=A0A7K0C7P9_9ACTN|nr:hypothetical protein [Actinomadura macrotermitis]MQY09477.1 hypothetical protein [Actinomadura macrotermitis]
MRCYQAVLRDQWPGVGDRIQRALSQWLQAEEGVRIPGSDKARREFSLGRFRLDLHRAATCGRYVVEDGDRERVRVTFAERAGSTPGWAVVTAERDPRVRRAPHFLPGYLRSARITDGGVQLPDTAQEVDETQVGELMNWLTRPRRRVPVVVFAHRDDGRELAGQLAATLAGNAVVAWLSDARAEDEFNARVGADVEVFGRGVRTYHPDFRGDGDKWRHPVLGGSKCDQGLDAFDLVIENVIDKGVGADPPEEIRHALRMVPRVLDGQEPATALTAVTPSPAVLKREQLRAAMMAKVPRPRPQEPPAARPPEPEPAAEETEEPRAVPVDTDGLARDVAERVSAEMRKELLAALEISVTESDREVVRGMRTVTEYFTALKTALDGGRPGGAPDLGEENDRLAQELAETSAEARKLRARVRWLERQLLESSGPVTPQPPEYEPAGLVDALNEAGDRLSGVLVVADRQPAATLDLSWPQWKRVWAGKAWEALRALDEFAVARRSGEFAGGFYDWCLQDAAGRCVLPSAMVSMTESQTVRDNGHFRAARTFPVPAELHPDGRVFMQAHIKLRRVGSPAPRLYFYDDSVGTSGKVWIGYLGDHLPNTRTN